MIHQRLTDGIIIALPILVLVASKSLSPLLAILAVLFLWNCRHTLNRSAWQSLRLEHAIFWSAGILLGWALLSAVWSLFPAESFSSWTRVASAMLAGLWLHYAIQFAPPLRRSTLAMATGLMILLIVILLFEKLTVSSRPIRALMLLTNGDYFTYIESNINRGLCALTVLIWPLVLGLSRAGYSRYAIALPVVMLLAFLSYESAAAIMGLAVGIFLWGALLLLPKHMPHIMRIGVPLLFFALPLLLYWFLHSAMSDEWRLVLAHQSSHRTMIWESLFKHGMSNPILGIGMNMSSHIPMDEALMKYLELQGPPMHPHCLPLQILLELGIVGLLAATLFLYALFTRLARIADEQLRNHALIAASVFLVTGLISFNVWQNWWIACGWFAVISWRRVATIGNT